jgi:hypothetical protein
MISTLIQKILDWTPEKANEFHSHITRSGDNSNKIWEVADNGLYLYGASSAVFYTTTGSSFHLKFGNIVNQLNILDKLSNLSKFHGLTEISCPSQITQVEIHGIPYTYWQETTPYGSNGISGEDISMFDHDYRNSSLVEFFKNLLIGIDDLIFVIDQLDENDRQYPSNLAVSNFFYDPLTTKYFWRTNFSLTMSKQHSIDNVKNFIEAFHNNSNVDIPNGIEELKIYMREKCKILNSII